MNKLLRFKKSLIALIFLGGFLFPSPTLAFWDFIGGLAGNIGAIIFAIPLTLIILVSSLLVRIASSLLYWSINFTSLSYTNPATNHVIASGLQITQSLANMFLVLVLVWIGIAVMLKLEGYETKKMLTRFIGTALLINFAPVLCGLAVDAANIIMNYFLNNGGVIASWGAGLNVLLSSKLSSLSSSSTWWNVGTEVVAELLMGAILNIAAIFIFLAFAFVLIVRKMIIWILVILAPIAFVFRILPFSMTKQYYEKWYNAFIEWTITGVVLSFFLYLGNGLVENPSTSTSYQGIGSFILPSMIPIVFYALGLMFGLSFMGMGSKILGKGQKYGKMFGMATLGKTWQATGGKALGSKTAQNLFQGMANPKSLIGSNKWYSNLAGNILGNSAVNFAGGWAVRAVGSAGLRQTAAVSKSIGSKKDDVEKQYGKKNFDAIAASYNDPLTSWEDKLAKALYLAEEGGAKAFEKLTESQRDEVLNYAASYSPHNLKTLVKIDPTLVNHSNPKLRDTIQKSTGFTSTEDVIKSFKSDDYKKVSKKSIVDIDYLFIDLIKNIKGKGLEALIGEMDTKELDGFTDKIKSQAGIAGKTVEQYLKDMNETAHKYLFDGLGKGLLNL